MPKEPVIIRILHSYDLPYGSKVSANFVMPDVIDKVDDDGAPLLGLVDTDDEGKATGVTVVAMRDDSDSTWFLDLPVDVARQLHERLGELFND